jgi:glycosyltransferase involved in cell wall biosynthesis
MELTILIPCLNEAQTLALMCRKGEGFHRAIPVSLPRFWSATTAPQTARRNLPAVLGARVVHARERGYGAALITGIQAASGRFVIMGDGDDSYDFSQLEEFVAELRNGPLIW